MLNRAPAVGFLSPRRDSDGPGAAAGGTVSGRLAAPRRISEDGCIQFCAIGRTLRARSREDPERGGAAGRYQTSTRARGRQRAVTCASTVSTMREPL